MPISKFAGKAQTVSGWIEGEALGITLPHEHLICDASFNFSEPEEAGEKPLAYKPVSMEISSWLRYHPSENLDNCQQSDEQEAIDEAMLFKKAGGSTIVEASCISLGRNPEALARISQATGLNIIMGSGYLVHRCHPPDMSDRTEDEITEEIVRDVNIGVGDTGIRAGIIGEIGASWPLHDNERKSIRAAAHAQQITGAPLYIHPGRINNKSVLEIIEILGDAGADLSRTVISHVELRIRDHDVRCQVAKAGCYIEYDSFGWEGHVPLSLYRHTDMNLPNDIQRIHEIMQLIEAGYLSKILISQDIWLKSWRTLYGGWGYVHISKYVTPAMLREGMSQEQINTIMVENPKRLLCFV
jgi:phosphotriesterase-related protein